MSSTYRVALLGFSDFERTSLASYFRLAQQRVPGYTLVELPADAHILLVDSDQPAAAQAVAAMERNADAVFVGAQAPEGAGAWMTRPIDPLHVLRELDVMVVLRKADPASFAAPPGAAPSPGWQPPSPMPKLTLRDLAPDTPLPQPADEATHNGDTTAGTIGESMRPAEPVPRAPLRPAASRGHALIVDDSEVALRFMEKQLLEFGLTPHRAMHSTRALELLGLHAFRLVILDVDLGEDSNLDGLALCHQIRHMPPPAGHSAPLVVMVSAHNDEVDRVRGTLAGCDAYFGKPLDLKALRQLLARHGIVRRAAGE